MRTTLLRGIAAMMVRSANANLIRIPEQSGDVDYRRVALSLQIIQQNISLARTQLVIGMREDGYTWDRIAQVMDLSKSAVWEMYHQITEEDNRGSSNAALS